MNFWAWALISPPGVAYGEQLGLTAFQQALLVALPVVVGSIGRIPVGALTDRLGARLILLGLWNTVASNIFGHYDYREGVSVWFRGIFRLSLPRSWMPLAPLGSSWPCCCPRCGRSPGSCTW